MKTRKPLWMLIVVSGLGIGSYGLYQFGLNQGKQQNALKNTITSTSSNTQAANQIDPTTTTGKRVLYWHDPMMPGQKFDKPGKSPFMDMQLVPVYADKEDDTGKVSINPQVQQNLGIRTVKVRKGTLTPTVDVVGSVAYNERDVAVVQARANGYLERLYVRAPLDPVRKGQALAELYVPDWVAAQEDFLAVQRMGENAPEGLLDGAQQRMRLAGMSDEQIRLIKTSGKTHLRLTITAPISGVVSELTARQGMTVMSGAPLFKISGLTTVWINAEVPENLAAQVRPGNVIEARTAALPDKVFHGKVSAILPEVNTATRTLKARVEVVNPSGQLVPGMFVRIYFTPNKEKEVLLIPSEAVIQTGQRSVVMVALDNGKFMPVNIEVGTEANGQTEVRKGLEIDQKVVVSGQFLIDSEASLKGLETRMNAVPPSNSGSKTDNIVYRGSGKIEKIDKDEITISHGPIPALQWRAMTMGFKLPTGGLAKNIVVGENVVFEIQQTPDGEFQITTITLIAESASRETKETGKGIGK